MSLSILRWHRYVLLALCVTYPATVLAQAAPADAPAPDAEKRKEEAKVRFQRGLELVQNESWDAALAEVTDVAAGSLLSLDGVAVGAERGLEAGRAREVQVVVMRAAGAERREVRSDVRLYGLDGADRAAPESWTLHASCTVAPAAVPTS